ncbi:MAG: ankyrin repeat domain-containing protein [Proteobacteria bacterium]|nr:ankyrin repeat domain-containing protein [Pseudomonadota bacterium]
MHPGVDDYYKEYHSDRALLDLKEGDELKAGIVKTQFMSFLSKKSADQLAPYGQASERLFAYILLKEQRQELIAIKMDYKRIKNSVFLMIENLMIMPSVLSKIILQYYAHFFYYLQDINYLFLHGSREAIMQEIQSCPNLALYRDVNYLNLLEIALSKRRIDSDMVSFLIRNKVPVPDQTKLKQYLNFRPIDQKWEKSIRYCVNAQYLTPSDRPFEPVQKGMSLINSVEQQAWYQANILLDQKAEIYAHKVTFMVNKQKTYYTDFESCDLFSTPNLYRGIPFINEAKVFYERLFALAPAAFTLGFANTFFTKNYIEPKHIEPFLFLFLEQRKYVLDIFSMAIKNRYEDLSEDVIYRKIYKYIVLAKILHKKKKINRYNANGQTAMQLAVAYGSPKMVRTILEMKAEIKDPTLLHLAVAYNSAATVRLLLAAKANIHAAVDPCVIGSTAPPTPQKITDEKLAFSSVCSFGKSIEFKGESLLERALNRQWERGLDQENIQIVSTLLEFKANPHLKDQNGKTAFFQVITTSLEILSSLKFKSFYELFLWHDDGRMFTLFKSLYSQNFWGLFSNQHNMQQMLAEGKIKNMQDVLMFVRAKEQHGEHNTNTHAALEQMKAVYLKNMDSYSENSLA